MRRLGLALAAAAFAAPALDAAAQPFDTATGPVQVCLLSTSHPAHQ